jgi:pimeloyl-ACP methyl ester carboxylesterase
MMRVRAAADAAKRCAENDVTPKFLMLAGAALLVCGANAMPPATPPANAADVPSDSYTHPQRLVTIDGSRRLNLFCLGTGSPTVLFEAGSGSNSSTWRHVQAQVATFTQACSYDRAGFGFSDPPSRTVDAANVVGDAQSLIDAAGLKTPLVLVGHSIGGEYDTLFAALHKPEVAGMVLVDPSFAHQFEKFSEGGTETENAKLYATLRGMGDGMRACRAQIAAAPAGPPPSAAEADCLPSASMPEHPDPVLLAALTQQWLHTAPNDAMISETKNFIPVSGGDNDPPADDTELDAASGNLGNMPLIVLTAGHTMANFPGLTDAQRTHFTEAWNAGHDALAQRSTKGKNVFVADSGHFIQIDKPAAVVDAVRQVVDQARGGP